MLYIVIPAYNEEENIEQCVNDWYPVVESYDGGGVSRLVIVNDGSKDRTYEKLIKLAETRPLLMPLNKVNGGHGSAVLYGYQYAVDQGADWIFQTDSDCQTDPAEFQAFWDAREEQEAVIGYRPDRGDGKDRKFVEGVVCFLLKMIFGVKVKDANAPFRLMRRELVTKYIQKLPKDFDLPNIMLTTYFVYYGHRVLFLPISFKPRRKGKNSINPKKIIKIGWKAVGDFRRLRKDMKDAEQRM
jgi:glycosyltransferase involved in cell wall biosynthesis